MKYLGKKSLSSFLYKFLRVVWYFVLIGSILAITFAAVVLFVIPVDAPCLAKIAKGMETTPLKIKELHIILKLLIFPYIAVVTALMLQIIRKAQYLFNNLRNNVVFQMNNVQFLSKISKLLIIFSILTFSIGSLISSLFLLVISEIFKHGTALKEENDLTI